MYNLQKKAYTCISSIKCGAIGPLNCYSVSMHIKTVQDRNIFCSKAPKTQKFDEFLRIKIFTISPKCWQFLHFFMALTSEPHCSMRILSQFLYHFDFINIHMFCLLFIRCGIFCWYSQDNHPKNHHRTSDSKVIRRLSLFYVNNVYCKYMFYNKNTLVIFLYFFFDNLSTMPKKAYCYFRNLLYFRV